MIDNNETFPKCWALRLLHGRLFKLILLEKNTLVAEYKGSNINVILLLISIFIVLIASLGLIVYLYYRLFMGLIELVSSPVLIVLSVACAMLGFSIIGLVKIHNGLRYKSRLSISSEYVNLTFYNKYGESCIFNGHLSECQLIGWVAPATVHNPPMHHIAIICKTQPHTIGLILLRSYDSDLWQDMLLKITQKCGLKVEIIHQLNHDLRKYLDRGIK